MAPVVVGSPDSGGSLRLRIVPNIFGLAATDHRHEDADEAFNTADSRSIRCDDKL